MRRLLAHIMAGAIVIFARTITAVRGVWKGVAPAPTRRVYFANHTSNGDFILLWAAIPPQYRRHTRPVAAADYWLKNKWRAFIGRDVVRGVLIDRNPETRTADPVSQMAEATDAGASLIIFPEGLRNMTGEALLPFKTGLYHLATQRPELELVPVWIENLNRVMPKGEIIPVPILCTVTFGAPLPYDADKTRFLQAAYDAVLALKPDTGDS
jgi:1-acyl-sn-glycerol-3-phosphate acyltransferase